MAISIRVIRPEGKDLGPWSFKEHAGDILIGRDPEVCHVLLPATETQVGRRHFALREQLGRYRLVLNEENVVTLDGEQALDGQEIPAGGAVLQLGSGPDAPRLQVEPAAIAPGLLSTDPHAGKVTQRGLLEGLRRRLALVAGIAGLLVVAIVAIVDRQRRTDESVVLTVAKLDELGVEARASLAGLDVRVTAADPTRLSQIAEGAKPSVLLVVARDRAGRESPMGTAWVAAPGRIATNAHVAKDVVDEPELTFLVRSAVAPFQTWEVADVELHPGYRLFEEILEDYEPFAVTLRGTEGKEFITICDVAVMEVVDPEGLPPPLPLATAGDLAALRVGADLVLVGYPTENIVAGGVDPEQPTATVQTGRITAVTNPFLGKPRSSGEGLPDDGILLQHSAPATGGASGSPMLDRNGRVVGILSAGNNIFTFGGRIPSAALINYAQRIDLLSELMGPAEALQSLQDLRLVSWRESLGRFHGANTPEGRLVLTMDEIAPRTATELRTERVTLDQQLLDSLDSEGEERGALLRISLPDEEREYLAIAAATGDDAEQRGRVGILVLSASDGTLLERADHDDDWFQAAWFQLESGMGGADVLLRGKAGADVDFRLYELVAPPDEPQEEYDEAE